MKWSLNKWHRFIEVWKTAKSRIEVAGRLDIPLRSVNLAVVELMDDGVNLKALPMGSVVDDKGTADFIQLWAECSTVEEMCERTGLNAQAISTKGWQIRKAGVKLKSFGPDRVDWEKLRELADRLHPDRRKKNEPASG